ncbi:protein of unknown function [Thermomonospora echinospora]|uniref:DUF1963 domain-containing protein n=1 Tax=Thermomonospora echinospora TaxID=1992 RepID=A0A1H5YP23_9ACTN|nr:DUF1963 domain-containing protein [Thermomonospora echinospora]SEG25754.1 protein of unknown function [Thermomonospora echinospora]
MATQETFFENARRRGVSADAIKTLRKWYRPCLSLETHGQGREIGHIGGLPMLPADATWDRHSLILTLDCAALPRKYLEVGFPEDGRLLLFGDNDVDGRGSVRYVPAGAETSERAAPQDEFDVLERRPLYASVSWSRKSPPHWVWGSEYADWLEADGLLGPGAEGLQACEEYHERCDGIPPDGRLGNIQVGGFANIAETPDHWSMAEHELRDRGVLPPDEAPDSEQPYPGDEERQALFRKYYAELAAEADQWVLLAQVLTQEAFDYSDGSMIWYIRQDDLASRRFDRAVSFCVYALS